MINRTSQSEGCGENESNWLNSEKSIMLVSECIQTVARLVFIAI
jgi:hypothetical protein